MAANRMYGDWRSFAPSQPWRRGALGSAEGARNRRFEPNGTRIGYLIQYLDHTTFCICQSSAPAVTSARPGIREHCPRYGRLSLGSAACRSVAPIPPTSRNGVSLVPTAHAAPPRPGPSLPCGARGDSRRRDAGRRTGRQRRGARRVAREAVRVAARWRRRRHFLCHHHVSDGGHQDAYVVASRRGPPGLVPAIVALDDGDGS